MSCDYCTKVTACLNELNASIQTNNVKWVCDPCLKKLEKKHKFFTLKMPRVRMKKWIERTRKK